MHRRSKQEHDVHRIGKALLVFWILGSLRIERVAVVALLDLARDLGTVGIAPVQQQFPCSQPSRVEVRQDSAGLPVSRGVGFLIRNQHALDVEPHAEGRECGEQQSDF